MNLVIKILFKKMFNVGKHFYFQPINKVLSVESLLFAMWCLGLASHKPDADRRTTLGIGLFSSQVLLVAERRVPPLMASQKW